MIKNVCAVIVAVCLYGSAQATDYLDRYPPLFGDVGIHKIAVEENYRAFDIAIPLLNAASLPELTYHRRVQDVRNHLSGWRRSGSHSVKANLTDGWALEAGRRFDRFGHPDDGFIGLSYTYRSTSANYNFIKEKRLGVDRGAQIPDHLRKDKKGLGMFTTAFSIALVAFLADDDDGATRVNDGPTANNWTLAWSDEFSGSTLDTSKWSTTDSYGRDQCFGGGNNEQQCYTSSGQNISVEDGKLVLTARPATGLSQGRTYTSGRVQSNGKGDFTYGKFEASIKLPTGQGSWPAFWMLPSRDNVDWPSRGEIDIMEAVNLGGNGGSTIHGTAHWGDPHTYLGGSANLSDIDDFHTYTVEWYPDEIRWFLNGNQYYRLTQDQWFSSDAPNDVNAPFDQDFHMILNFAVGGNWPQASDGTNFPRQMEVDYVRVYQCEGDDPLACK